MNGKEGTNERKPRLFQYMIQLEEKPALGARGMKSEEEIFQSPSRAIVCERSQRGQTEQFRTRARARSRDIYTRV